MLMVLCRMMRVVGLALFFGAFGPPIGSTLFALLALLASTSDSGLPVKQWGEFISGLAFFSYFVGLIPALITGAIAGFYAHKLKSWLSFAAVGIIGCLMVNVFLLFMDSAKNNSHSGAVTFGLLGFCSATILSALYGWVSSRFASLNQVIPSEGERH
jgi:uncharacterized membrane protein YeaQ/YmgE (transglycosylase-associated protein family)